MGIVRQLRVETSMALSAMMQSAPGPKKQYVPVYHVPDKDREKEAGHGRMWSHPVKVKLWEEHLHTDAHIFFRQCKVLDWSAYGPIQSVGRREALKRPAIPDVTQSTDFVTQETFFALGMGCTSHPTLPRYDIQLIKP